MAAILFFKMSQKMTESKRYGLTVHCKAVAEIIREIQMLLKKMRMRVTATPPKEAQPIRTQQPKLLTDCPLY